MGDLRRDLLAVQLIVVTYLAALRAFAPEPESDIRAATLHAARHRALTLLTAAEQNLSYIPGSPLDIALKDARRRIEEGASG